MSVSARSFKALAGGLRNGQLGTTEDLDWADLLAFANAHMVGPALYGRLAETGRLDLLPHEVRDYLELLHRLNGERNQAIRQQAQELIAGLNRDGIEPILLKGGLTLFAGPYADPAARMVGDIDIAVPAAALQTAIAALHRLGYGGATQYPDGHHAYGDFVRDGDPSAIDLHIELVDQSYLLPARDLWAEAERRDGNGLRWHSPSPTHRLLHTLLHAQVHHLGNFYRGEIRLRQLHEFTLSADSDFPMIDWTEIDGRLSGHRLETPLDSYLLAAERLFGLAWPLSRRPMLAAELHVRRCLLQLRFGAPERLVSAWGNLRGAFAWHRMHALYGERLPNAGLLRWQIEHARRYLRQRPAEQVMGRLFRTE